MKAVRPSIEKARRRVAAIGGSPPLVVGILARRMHYDPSHGSVPYKRLIQRAFPRSFFNRSSIVFQYAIEELLKNDRRTIEERPYL